MSSLTPILPGLVLLERGAVSSRVNVWLLAKINPLRGSQVYQVRSTLSVVAESVFCGKI